MSELSREDMLLGLFERNGFKRHNGELPREAAVRLFRERWPQGGDVLLETLACCCGVSCEEMATLACGTLWLCDEPGIAPPPEERFAEGRERFLRLLLGSSYVKPGALAA